MIWFSVSPAVVYLAIWAWIWNEVVSITILLLLVIIIIIISSKLIIIVTIITCLPPLKWNVNSFIFIGTPWQAVCCFRKSRYLPVSFYGTLKNFKSSLSTFLNQWQNDFEYTIYMWNKRNNVSTFFEWLRLQGWLKCSFCRNSVGMKLVRKICKEELLNLLKS